VVFAEFERSIIQERVQGRLGVSSILAVRLFFGTIILMKRQSLVPKKRRGPAPTGKGIQIQVRIQPNKLAQLDRWIANQNDRPSRPEAIRRIVERALAHSSRPKGIKKKGTKGIGSGIPRRRSHHRQINTVRRTTASQAGAD
jgi:hypothetical protein